VFTLIGLSLREVLARVGGVGVIVNDMAVPILAILLALTLARFAWIFACEGWLVVQNALGYQRYEPMGWRAAAVLSWAGMRGVVTLAVALSVPATMPGRDFMLVTAFAVILVTVLVQGMSLGPVIRWAQPRETGRVPVRLTMSGAEAAMARAQFEAVEKQAYGPDGTLLHPQLLEKYKKRAEVIVRYVGNEDQYQPGLQAHFDVVLVAIAAGRAELLRLHRAGDIDDRTLHELEHDLDLEELGAWSAKAT
jgi:CPA1 family monovalent cation:H+ antiporter